jgi:predicted enzyme related to lactoylglutathione lyase
MSEHGVFYWNELLSNDVDAARAFYEKAMGWSFDAMPMDDGTYWVAKTGDKPAGGMMAMPEGLPPGMPSHWMAYISVDDIDARLKTAEENGATIVRPPFDVPGIGRIAILQDPSGGAIGWMTPAPQSG